MTSVGKRFKQTVNAVFQDGGYELTFAVNSNLLCVIRFDQIAQLEITDSGLIQSIKFGILAEHPWATDIYLWVVRPGEFNAPQIYTINGIITLN